MIKTTTRQGIILYQAVIIIKPLFMPLPKANGCKPEIEMLTYTLI